MSSVFKFLLILLAAIILAIGARIFYISSLTPKQISDSLVRIRVAAADLPAGLLLRDSDLSWQQVPESKVPKNALTEGTDPSGLVGALLRHQVDSGAVLKIDDVIQSDAPGFLAAALRPGTVAVSVPVNSVSGNAGLIQPGDYVDIILTQQLGGRGDFGGNHKQVVSETVVQQARIIAVGSSFKRGSDKTDPIRANTVTFEAPPRIAEAITVASELGSLSLALRSFARTDTTISAQGSDAAVVAWDNHQQVGETGPIWGNDVSRARQNASAEAQQATAANDSPITGLVNDAIASVRQPTYVTVVRGTDQQAMPLNTFPTAPSDSSFVLGGQPQEILQNSSANAALSNIVQNNGARH